MAMLVGEDRKGNYFSSDFFSSLHFLPRRLERPTPAGKERGHIVSCFSMLLLPLSRFVGKGLADYAFAGFISLGLGISDGTPVELARV